MKKETPRFSVRALIEIDIKKKEERFNKKNEVFNKDILKEFLSDSIFQNKNFKSRISGYVDTINKYS